MEESLLSDAVQSEAASEPLESRGCQARILHVPWSNGLNDFVIKMVPSTATSRSASAQVADENYPLAVFTLCPSMRPACSCLSERLSVGSRRIVGILSIDVGLELHCNRADV